MSLENSQLLETYKKMMIFISNIVAEDCEIVLHNVQGDTCIIEEIINPIISGRKKGQQTDALGIYHSEKYSEKDFSNTRYYTSKKGNTIKGNTFFIKNPQGELIGMMCVNMNVSDLVNAHNWIASFMDGFIPKALETETNPVGTIEEYTFSTIDQVVAESKIETSRMSVEEKIDVLRVLDSKGVFSVKGTMGYISKRLNISEPTLYRYLKEL